MIEIRRAQRTFGDGLIAEEVKDLHEGWMKHADVVLADEAIVATVYEALAKRHPKSRCRGRRGAPADMVLRLLVLKHIRNWSYEVLEREVRANLVYRDFTHVGGGKTPDAKTMGRWGLALGPEVLKQVHAGVVRIARDKGVTAGRRMRVDTTVVETDIHHPTDSTLLGDEVQVLTRIMRKITTMAGTVGTKLRDRTRSVKLRLLEVWTGGARQRPDQPGQIGATLSPIVGYDEPGGRTGERRFSEEIAQGMKGSTNALKQLVLEGLRQELDEMTSRVRQVMKQTKGTYLPRQHARRRRSSSACSSHRPRSFARARLAKPNEIGKMVKLQEAENQIITDYEVYARRPHDSSLLVAAIETHQALPRTHAAFGGGGAPPPSIRPEEQGQPRGRRASNASAFPTAQPRASNANASRENAGSALARSSAPGPKAGSAWSQAATRSRSMPLSRGYVGMNRWAGLGVIADNVAQHPAALSRGARSPITPASPRSVRPAIHPRRVLRRRAQLTTALKDQFCAGKYA